MDSMDARSGWKSITKASMIAVFAALICLLPTTSEADTYATYDLSGTFASGGSLSGSFTIDLTNGNFTATGPIVADGLNFTCANSNSCLRYVVYSGTDQVALYQGTASQPFLVLNWINSGWSFPVGSAPSTMIFTSSYSYCKNCVAGLQFDMLTSGTATLDPVPEPATLGLLATGLLGLGLTRRRRSQV